jgi:hypothetical protein
LISAFFASRRIATDALDSIDGTHAGKMPGIGLEPVVEDRFVQYELGCRPFCLSGWVPGVAGRAKKKGTERKREYPKIPPCSCMERKIQFHCWTQRIQFSNPDFSGN